MLKFKETPEELKQYLEQLVQIADDSVDKMKASVVSYDKTTRYQMLTHFLSWNGVSIIVQATHAKMALVLLERHRKITECADGVDQVWYDRVKSVAQREVSNTELRIGHGSTSASSNFTTDAERSFWIDMFGATHRGY